VIRREAWLIELEHLADAEDPRVSDSCFKILYGLAPSIQMALPLNAMKRFVPIFHWKNPGATEPQQLLDNPEAWFRERGRSFELESTNDQSEAAFLFSIHALLLALAYPSEPFTLTSSCACAVAAAVSARALNVWTADEPEAAALSDLEVETPHRVPKGRTVLDNVAAKAVTRREWKEVGRWLRRAEVLDAPDVSDPAEVEAALKRWTEIEHLIVVPNQPWRESLRAETERLRKVRDGDDGPRLSGDIPVKPPESKS
jgi:hypothetical protein